MQKTVSSPQGPMSGSTGKLVRYTLGSLLFLVALNAFAGGYYGMAGAESVPVEWLQGSPFSDYFLPALVLFVVVGGSCLIAGILVFRRHRLSRISTLIAGTVIITWLSVQLAIIGYVSWMQPATAVAALLIMVLAWRLPR